MKHVKLPSGTSVPVSTEQEDWWFTDGMTGYVHPSMLAPDPGQPRKAIGGGDWKEFRHSIKTAGVREYIRVTPREHAPWVKLDAGDHRPFIINSGHRRHLAATQEHVSAVPIVIKIYASQIEWEREAAGLNGPRKDLTPLEQAMVIKQGQDRGDSWEMICADVGLSQSAAIKRANLVHLAPDIKHLIDPEVRQGTRSDFPVGVAEALGAITDVEAGNFLDMMEQYEFTKEDVPLDDADGENKLNFGLQRALLARIEEKELSSAQAIEFIKSGRVRHNGGYYGTQSDSSTRSAQNIYRMLKAGVKAATRSKSVSLNRSMIRSACADKSAVEVKALMEDALKSVEEVGRVLEILGNILEAKQQRAAIKPLSSEERGDQGKSLMGDKKLAAEIAAKYGAILAPLPSS